MTAIEHQPTERPIGFGRLKRKEDARLIQGKDEVPGVVHRAHSGTNRRSSAPGLFVFYPLQPLKDFMRTLAALGQLTEIRRNLNRVLKHLQPPDRP
mgnify:CR=1 FL=1